MWEGLWIATAVIAALVVIAALTLGLVLYRRRRISLSPRPERGVVDRSGGYTASSGITFSQTPTTQPAERIDTSGLPAVGDDATVPRDAPKRTIADVHLPEFEPEPQAPEVPEADAIAPPEGRLERLRGRLARSQNALGRGLLGLIGGGDLDEDSVTVAFLGDGATSEGDVHEALNFAAVFTTPCVFYVQNNQWAISMPVSRQTAAPSIAHKAIGYGMPGIRVDGNDVLACYAVMAEAAARARAGDGPTLIEAVTYRLGPHTTADDPTRYRSQEEVDRWATLDPIPRYRTYLQDQGLWSQRLEEQVTARAKHVRSELRDAVFDAPDFDVDEVFTTVYAEITPGLQAQREQLRAELARTD